MSRTTPRPPEKSPPPNTDGQRPPFIEIRTALTGLDRTAGLRRWRRSSGAGEAEILRYVATNVTMGIDPDSGHWIMEKNPQATTKLIVYFVAK
jgi:hypothetical protein